jgi:hypothetical protein
MATAERGWTAGPWHVEPVTGEDDEQFWSDDWNGKVWCVCHPQTECNATTVVDWINEGDAHLIAAAPCLYAAAADALAGWRYIREQHGDLYGIGWDRVEQALTAALARANPAPKADGGAA